MKPLITKVSGPTQSKSGHTESQFVATVVAPDGSVRYLTWSSSIQPDELADSIKEAWGKVVMERSGGLLGQAAPQPQVPVAAGTVPVPQGGAAEDRPAPTAGSAAPPTPQAPPAPATTNTGSAGSGR